MIKIGKILIDPSQIDLVTDCTKWVGSYGNNHIEPYIIVTFKSGVTKQISETNLGIPCADFIDQFIKINQRTEDKKILKLMAALNNK